MLPNKILSLIAPFAQVEADGVTLTLKQDPTYEQIKYIVWEYVFAKDSQIKKAAKLVLWEFAFQKGIFFDSIVDVYKARGQNKLATNFTVPAFNIRGLTFDFAKLVFDIAKAKNNNHFIFEIARTEMKYTLQSPEEYSTCILAGALAAGYSGPVYIQGDHFQPQPEKPGVAKEGEYQAIKTLIDEAIENGFFNIDIDCSMLVDLSLPTVIEQQRENIRGTLELAKYIRHNQPQGVEISLGGEIGHIGGKNSTIEELEVFLNGFYEGWGMPDYGLSKIAIQNGTSHGGSIGPDGKVKEIEVDLELMLQASRICRDKYQISGAVQHGASTQSLEFLRKLPQHEIIEVHLATGIQNAFFDDPAFPADLKKSMSAWILLDLKEELDPNWTVAQSEYRMRKKAWGKFKREFWDHGLNYDVMRPVFEGYFDNLFLPKV